MAFNENSQHFSERQEQLAREIEQVVDEEWRILGPRLYEDGGAENFPWPLRHFGKYRRVIHFVVGYIRLIFIVFYFRYCCIKPNERW